MNRYIDRPINGNTVHIGSDQLQLIGEIRTALLYAMQPKKGLPEFYPSGYPLLIPQTCQFVGSEQTDGGLCLLFDIQAKAPEHADGVPVRVVIVVNREF